MQMPYEQLIMEAQEFPEEVILYITNMYRVFRVCGSMHLQSIKTPN